MIIIFLLIIIVILFCWQPIKENFQVINDKLFATGTGSHINGYNDFNPNRGLMIEWNNQQGMGEVDLVSNGQGGAGGFNFYKTDSGNQGLTKMAQIDSGGTLTTYNNEQVSGNLSSNSLNVNNIRQNGSYSMNSSSNFQIDAPNIVGGRVKIDTTGNVDINQGKFKIDTLGNVTVSGNVTVGGKVNPVITQAVNMNNGSVTCDTYCRGNNGASWNNELPASWKGAVATSATAGQRSNCVCQKTGLGWK